MGLPHPARYWSLLSWCSCPSILQLEWDRRRKHPIGWNSFQLPKTQRPPLALPLTEGSRTCREVSPTLPCVGAAAGHEAEGRDRESRPGRWQFQRIESRVLNSPLWKAQAKRVLKRYSTEEACRGAPLDSTAPEQSPQQEAGWRFECWNLEVAYASGDAGNQSGLEVV